MHTGNKLTLGGGDCSQEMLALPAMRARLLQANPRAGRRAPHRPDGCVPNMHMSRDRRDLHAPAPLSASLGGCGGAPWSRSWATPQACSEPESRRVEPKTGPPRKHQEGCSLSPDVCPHQHGGPLRGRIPVPTAGRQPGHQPGLSRQGHGECPALGSCFRVHLHPDSMAAPSRLHHRLPSADGQGCPTLQGTTKGWMIPLHGDTGPAGHTQERQTI